MTIIRAMEYSADSRCCSAVTMGGFLAALFKSQKPSQRTSHDVVVAAKRLRRDSAHAFFKDFAVRLCSAGICRNARTAQQYSPLSHPEFDDSRNGGDRRKKSDIGF